ncbi:hypothetical protein BBJ29_002877 [Phytophthora kernoviae]|uniref:HRDC domain-containing protein n=1 Tax=Phytophthora kernoviae TaxID=325452 RepID=A0A421G4L6_9STRA|nr:hypothetical protein BBJ29_002877 [Phytophthora kernoviae]
MPRQVLNYHDVQLYDSDVALFSSQQWLNDNAINFYLQYLAQTRCLSDVLLMDPSVVSCLLHQCEEEDEYADLAGGLALKDKQLCLIPVSDNEALGGQSSHWSLLLFQDGHFRHFDSSGGHNKHSARRIAQAFEVLLRAVDRHDGDGAAEQVDDVEDAPQQQNGYDCGIPEGELVCNPRKTFLYETDKPWATAGDCFCTWHCPWLDKTISFGICMDINPDDFQAPFSAYEFGSHVLEHKSDLVLFACAWNDFEPHDVPPYKTLSYWAQRLSPVIDALSSGAYPKANCHFLCSNRIGSENGTFFVGASCALSLKEPAVVAHAGRRTEELLPVHAKIVGTLRAFKPNAPPKVLERLPGLAYRMEESLFKLATNQAEYSDPSTLPQRIACIQENNAKRLLHQQQQQPPPSVPQKGAVSQGSDGAMQVSKPLAEEQARAVFQHLQTWRQKLVNVYGVAPWEILPNQTLAKVALYMPASEQELIVCGVHEEQVARFGSSLMQELHHLRGSAPTPSKPANRPIKSAATKQSRKSEAAKRASSGSVGGGSTKKRKNGNAALLAPVASPNVNSTSLMSPSQMMFQSSGVESLPATLPTLLPSASMPTAGANSANSSSSSTPVRLSPAGLAIQQPFFSRVQQPLPHQQQGLTPPAQQNHMHLLAQGAGQLSKQQDGKSLEAYEQEVQSLRWMLHQSQQEKSQLESEVQRLRAQLQGCSK